GRGRPLRPADPAARRGDPRARDSYGDPRENGCGQPRRGLPEAHRGRGRGMSPGRTWATALRVLRQLRHDPRTIALLLVVPCVLEILVHALFSDSPQVFQKLGVPLLGLFPFIAMFIVTSITMLRERVSGTLERLLTTPIARGDLLVGYGIAFALV